MLLVTIAASVVTGALAVSISLRVQESNNAKFCTIVVAQDDAYATTPPATPTGKKIAAAMHKLRRDLHC